MYKILRCDPRLFEKDLSDHIYVITGEYYSQNSILYPKKENRPGGWPMLSPNLLTDDDDLARRLYESSLELVGLID